MNRKSKVRVILKCFVCKKPMFKKAQKHASSREWRGRMVYAHWRCAEKDKATWYINREPWED